MPANMDELRGYLHLHWGTDELRAEAEACFLSYLEELYDKILYGPDYDRLIWEYVRDAIAQVPMNYGQPYYWLRRALQLARVPVPWQTPRTTPEFIYSRRDPGWETPFIMLDGSGTTCDWPDGWKGLVEYGCSLSDERMKQLHLGCLTLYERGEPAVWHQIGSYS